MEDGGKCKKVEGPGMTRRWWEIERVFFILLVEIDIECVLLIPLSCQLVKFRIISLFHALKVQFSEPVDSEMGLWVQTRLYLWPQNIILCFDLLLVIILIFTLNFFIWVLLRQRHFNFGLLWFFVIMKIFDSFSDNLFFLILSIHIGVDTVLFLYLLFDLRGGGISNLMLLLEFRLDCFWQSWLLFSLFSLIWHHHYAQILLFREELSIRRVTIREIEIISLESLDGFRHI